MKRGLKNLLILALIVLGAGYLGNQHPAGDSLAVFRPQIAVAVIFLAGLLWLALARRWALVGFVAAGAALGPIVWLYSTGNAEGRTELSLYQKNMRFLVEDPGLLAHDVLARAPDFLTLQEVSGVNMAVFDPLEKTYKSRQFCPFATVGGVAVASRWPMVAGSSFCAEADGLAAMRVVTPQGPVWVVSIHLHWPWPYSQPAHIARLLPILQGLEGPMVIGGDFNMVPWSTSFEMIEAVSGTERIGPPHVSLTKANGWMRVPIDHVLVTGGQGRVQRLPRLGSDHYGLLARFAI
ncbi:endonuclease/exonuclease/phosphatase family protein [Aliiroseovarius sp. 2305UL8-7]|uniref:endonuclease/exonuclease/phosphatase family protein n=1 Tax=Aliiroseovarius conchicola TaxID=3121637 RepID=UPI003529B1A8